MNAGKAIAALVFLGVAASVSSPAVAFFFLLAAAGLVLFPLEGRCED